MEKDYGNAYSEVLDILKYIPKEDYDKIPRKTIQLLEANRNEKSEFTYNVALPFDKQDISKDAKVILAILYRNCWISEGEKIELSKKEKEHLQNIEKEKREKYNPDDLFTNREQNITRELEENHYLVVQEKWYIKVLSKIKKFLKLK